MSSQEFKVVAKRGTVFNLTDCGIPLDITDHRVIDLSTTSTEKERESSMQLRHALNTGHVIRILPEEKAPELPPTPEPLFTIPVLKATIDGGASLSASTSIKKVEHKHAPDSYEITEEVSDEVRERIAGGIASNKADDFAEQQRILAGASEEEESEIDQMVRSGRKAIPELATGTVDGKPVGYEFKAPLSPALEQANAGMGDQLPTAEVKETSDPLNAEKPVKKGKKNKAQETA